MVRRVERPVGLADRGEQAVERPDHGDRERGDDEVVAEAQGEVDAGEAEQRQQRIRQRELAEERHARSDVGVDEERQHRGDSRACGQPDELRGRRRPSLADHDEHDDGDEPHQDRPAVDAVVAFASGSAFAAAAVGAEHLGDLVPDERDREPGHQARHDGIRHEARDVAEAQQAEQDLDDAGHREAKRGEQDDLLDGELLLGEAQDERGEQEHRGRARDFVGQQRAGEHERREVAEDRRRQGRAQAGLDRVASRGGERDEPQGQHHRQQHEGGGDARADLAREFGGVAWRGDAMGVVSRVGHA